MKKIGFILTLAMIAACTLGEKTTQNSTQTMETNNKQLQSSVGKVFGFYNVENLFDTIDDKYTIDEQFLPDSEKEWNTTKYFDKLNKLAKVITAMDKDLPIFMGFAEIENQGVILDLISNTNLNNGNYGIVHYESPDKRGIDVGFMYRKEFMTIKHSENIEVSLPDNPDFATRDILYVQGELKGEDELHVFLNHWSSRRAGQKESEHKRVKAASVLRAKVDEILNKDASAKIIIMGDFNDYPTNKSVYEVLKAKGTPA
ncbi:MAG: hypothetical protein ABF258_05635, partial [Flavobacteriales bacterium]